MYRLMVLIAVALSVSGCNFETMSAQAVVASGRWGGGGGGREPRTAVRADANMMKSFFAIGLLGLE
jgi:hypothetical protein